MTKVKSKKRKPIKKHVSKNESRTKTVFQEDCNMIQKRLENEESYMQSIVH